MPNDTQHRFLEMYEGNPASYLDRLIQLNQNIVDEINTINSDSTSSHAISITNEVKEIYAQVEELYKLASLMCHHISLIPVPQQPSRWNKFLHIFQRTSEQQMFTVKEQEYFLQRYKCNTQVNVTSDAMNSLFDGFENKIVFSGIIFVDKKRKKWKYEITHTADLSSKNTVTCLEVGDYFDFHFRDNFDHKDGSHYWSVRIGENETDSFSSNHYNNDYYNTAMQQLAQIKAQIQANLPGALEIALIYPIPGTLSIELALK
jgi:predicted protein tyrosine phosphatase